MYSDQQPQSADDNQPSGAINRWQGRSLVIGAAVLWSTSGLFAKAPIFEDWPPEIRGLLLAFWRAAFASLVLVFLVRRAQWSWRMLPMVVTFAAMNWTFLNALVHCEATLAIWLQYTAPVWVFVGSAIFFQEQPSRGDWILLALAAMGTLVILSAELKDATSIGLCYGLASGFFFAGVVLSLRWLRDVDSAWLVFLNHSVTCALLAPVVVIHGICPVGWQWSYLFFFGALQMGIPYVLFALSVRRVSGHEASALTLLEPILLPLWVFLAWHGSDDYQPPVWTTLAGGGLILAGLVFRYASRIRQPC